MAVALERYRFTVNEYDQMTAAGILTEDDRVELLDGEIVKMAAMGPRHAATVARTADILAERLGRTVMVRSQSPVRLVPHSEPEPDVMVIRRRADYYAGSHPAPDDLFLLVEVADTSLRLDREVKIPIYARSGIREVWLADIDGGTLHVFRSPSPEGYKVQQVVQRGQALAPEAFPEFTVSVEELLGS